MTGSYYSCAKKECGYIMICNARFILAVDVATPRHLSSSVGLYVILDVHTSCAKVPGSYVLPRQARDSTVEQTTCVKMASHLHLISPKPIIIICAAFVPVSAVTIFVCAAFVTEMFTWCHQREVTPVLPIHFHSLNSFRL